MIELWIIISLVVLAIGLVVFILAEEFYVIPSRKCGIEQCHGLDITCGPNVPDACTMIYQLGDRCRQYVNCEVIGGECTLVKTGRFEECKACVEKCLEGFQGSEAFECESLC
jgi:hypothetical protein